MERRNIHSLRAKYLSEQPDQVVKECTAALEYEGSPEENLELLKMRANAYERLEKYMEALEDLNKYGKISPNVQITKEIIRVKKLAEAHETPVADDKPTARVKIDMFGDSSDDEI